MYKYSNADGHARILDDKGDTFKSYGKANDTIEMVAKARIKKLNKELPKEPPTVVAEGRETLNTEMTTRR